MGMEEMLAKVGYNTKKHGHSQYNNLKAYASEVSYKGTTPTTTFAENVATNSPRRHSAAALVDGWMNSSGHKKNILNRELHYIGPIFLYDYRTILLSFRLRLK